MDSERGSRRLSSNGNIGFRDITQSLTKLFHIIFNVQLDCWLYLFRFEACSVILRNKSNIACAPMHKSIDKSASCWQTQRASFSAWMFLSSKALAVGLIDSSAPRKLMRSSDRKWATTTWTSRFKLNWFSQSAERYFTVWHSIQLPEMSMVMLCEAIMSAEATWQ